MPRGEGFHNLEKKKKRQKKGDFSCTQRLLYKWWPTDKNTILDTVCCHLICLRLKNENITYDNIANRQSDHNFWLCNLWLQWFLTCFDIESACRRIPQSKRNTIPHKNHRCHSIFDHSSQKPQYGLLRETTSLSVTRHLLLYGNVHLH